MPSELRLHLDKPGTDQARAEELERGTAILLLVEMTERWGIERVHRWLRNIGHAQGEEVCR
jgi:hypothetical protein